MNLIYLIMFLPFIGAYVFFQLVKKHEKIEEDRIEETRKEEEEEEARFLRERVEEIHNMDYPQFSDLVFLKNNETPFFNVINSVFKWVADYGPYTGRESIYTDRLLINALGDTEYLSLKNEVISCIQKILLNNLGYGDSKETDEFKVKIMLECDRIHDLIVSYNQRIRTKNRFKSKTSFRRSCINKPAKCKNTCRC